MLRIQRSALRRHQIAIAAAHDAHDGHAARFICRTALNAAWTPGLWDRDIHHASMTTTMTPAHRMLIPPIS
ncbi:hypothetical protein DBA20_13070 [Pandoraea capi]|nr:hypothetical protein [Pandoraea sp. LA3]MDN4583915.1 hypothetical protein [Pandoraea capi]